MVRTNVTISLFLLAFSHFACRPAESTESEPKATGNRYGVMTGQLTGHYLEPEQGEGRWPHYVIELTNNRGPARAVINFKSRYAKEMQYRLLQNIPQERFASLRDTDRFKALTRNSTSGALDYLRHPDLQSAPEDWVLDDAIDADVYLNQALQDVDQVMIYGYGFSTGEGMHRVHMEQGDVPGTPYANTNRPWQDGALLYWHNVEGELQLDAFLVKFTNQSFCTNEQGKAIDCPAN
jgi:uncharacterized protein YukJ